MSRLNAERGLATILPSISDGNLDEALVTWQGSTVMKMMAGDIAAEEAHTQWKKIKSCKGKDVATFSKGKTWCKTSLNCDRLGQQPDKV
ncbi:MAG: hypothetical protein ACK2UX_15015 [Anaerolineae bacterium]